MTEHYVSTTLRFHVDEEGFARAMIPIPRGVRGISFTLSELMDLACIVQHFDVEQYERDSRGE